MLVEVKSNEKQYQKSQKQLFDGKEKIKDIFAALGFKPTWKFIGVFFALNGTNSSLFNCEKCCLFAIIGIDTFPGQIKNIEKEVKKSHISWYPSEHVKEFVEIAKQMLFIAQGDPFAPVTESGVINKTAHYINRVSTSQNILLWTPEQLSVIQAMDMPYVIFDGFYSTGKSEVLKYFGKHHLKIGRIVHYFNQRPVGMKDNPNLLPFTMMLQKEFPEGIVKETTFRFGIDSVSEFLLQNGIEPHHHVIFDEVICIKYCKGFLDSLVAMKMNVASLWIAMGSVPLQGENSEIT